MTKIALVGTGPVALGFITQMAISLEKGETVAIESINIFDSYGKYGLGAGLPYDLETTDPEHLLNVKSSSNVDSFGESIEWFRENELELKGKFRSIYEERLTEKLTRVKSPEEEENLRQHYAKIWQSIEKRYLDFRVAEEYHPRILLGMRNIFIFEEALQKIKAHGIEVHEHRQTEVTALDKIQEGEIKLGFVDHSKNYAEENFNEVVLATGRWRVRDKDPKPRFVPEIWPISEFKSDLIRILHEEISQRKEKGDENKEITIAIQGQSLTAIDAIKTIFNEGLFEEEISEDGGTKWKFTPSDFEGYSIKVDLLARTKNLMQAVKGKDGWQRQEKFSRTFPQGTEIRQKDLQELAGEQEGKIRLWQWMLLNARALENGYLIEGLENQANQARDFTKVIIKTISGRELPENSDAILSDVKGSSLEQFRQIQNLFELPLDGANYQPIMEEFRAKFLNKPQIEQLRENLAMAESGDTKDGYLMWKSIYGQNDEMFITPLLTPEESAFHLQFLIRIRDAFHNGMPIKTAKEILAMHEAGVIEFVTIDRDREPQYNSEGKVVIRTADQNERVYDAVASARGYSIDFTKNVSPLAQSLSRYFSFVEESWRPNLEDLKTRFGEQEAREMMKFHRNGNFCTGDYRRNVISHGGRSIIRQPIDENNQVVLPEVTMAISGGTSGAIENGKEIFLYKFARQQSKSTSQPIPSTDTSARPGSQKLIGETRADEIVMN